MLPHTIEASDLEAGILSDRFCLTALTILTLVLTPAPFVGLAYYAAVKWMGV